MYRVKLESGRQARVRCFHQTLTYAGLLEGRPTAKLNARIIEQATERASRVWGERPTYVCPPKVDASAPAHPRLPRVECMAWLISEPLSTECCGGSELVVLWFEEEPPTSLPALFRRVLRAVPWDTKARDFEE